MQETTQIDAGKSRRPPLQNAAAIESSRVLDDEENELTELGKQFVRYTMEGVMPRIAPPVEEYPSPGSPAAYLPYVDARYKPRFSFRRNGGAGESRTPDTQFRKLLLYPSELQPRDHCKDSNPD